MGRAFAASYIDRMWSRLSQPQTLLLVLAAAAAAALGVALISQYVFGLLPCELCIYQRWPLAAIAVLGAAAALLLRGDRNRGLARAAVGACALLFLLDAGIAGFHVGVEQGWWEGTSECTAPSSGAASLEELRAQIMNAPVIQCDEVAFSLFGISMAGYNFLFCLLMTALSGRALYRRGSTLAPA